MWRKIVNCGNGFSPSFTDDFVAKAAVRVQQDNLLMRTFEVLRIFYWNFSWLQILILMNFADFRGFLDARGESGRGRVVDRLLFPGLGAIVQHGFKNFLQNFGDLSQFWRFWWFWYRLQNFGKSLSHLLPHIGTNFSKFRLSNFDEIIKLWINHRGGILIFGQILSKLKILDFRVKDLKFCDFVKFLILGLRISNFEISPILSISVKIFFKFVTKIIKKSKHFVSKLEIFVLGLRISNFEILGFKDFKFYQNPNFTKITKFYKNHQILQKSPNFIKKILNITNFLWVLGDCSHSLGRGATRRRRVPHYPDAKACWQQQAILGCHERLPHGTSDSSAFVLRIFLTKF